MTSSEEQQEYYDEFLTDFEIDKSHQVKDFVKKEHNSFESCEVESPADLDSITRNLSKSLEEQHIIATLPEVKVFNDEDIPWVVHHESTKQKEEPRFVCDRCSKIYKKQLFYVKHISLCHQEESKNDRNLVLNAATNEEQNTLETKPFQTTPSTKQSKRAVEATLQPTDEDLLDSAVGILENALKAAINDRNHNRKLKYISPGNKIKLCAEHILSVFQTEEGLLEKEAIRILQYFAPIVKSTDLSKTNSKEKMWEEIGKEIRKGKLFDFWNEVISSDENTRPYASNIGGLCYHVSMNICLALVKQMKEELKLKSHRHDVPNTELTKDEQNVIYYVAGYILHALLKKYYSIKKSRPQNVSAAACIYFLTSLRGNPGNAGNPALSFVKEWNEAQDRGGLVKVSDQMFIFIKSIENSVRYILNIQFLCDYSGEDLRDILHSRLKDDYFVNLNWERLSRFIPSSELADHLKDQILSRWVDLRAYSFVKAYVQILRRKSAEESMAAKKIQLSKASEKGLRKSLQEDGKDGI